jgi:hypothetical protein
MLHNDEYEAFCDRAPFEVSMEREEKESPVTITEDSGEQRVETRKQEFAVFRFHIREEPPHAWSTIIGDCVQNARSALEHLAWQLAQPEHGGSGPNVYTGFPIYRKRRTYRKTKESERSAVARMGADAETEIEKLQPYHSRNGVEHDPLFILNELARIDRHQVLHLVAAAMTGPSLASHAPIMKGEDEIHFAPAIFDDAAIEKMPLVRNPIVRRDVYELGEIVSRNPGPSYAKRPVKFSAGYFVAFADTEPVIGLPIVQTLDRLMNYVEAVVLPRFVSC